MWAYYYFFYNCIYHSICITPPKIVQVIDRCVKSLPHRLKPAMPCNSPTFSQTVSSSASPSVVQTQQFHVQSLYGIQEDGVGRPIVQGARLLVPKCSAINNYLKQLRMSTARIPKLLPSIKQFAPLAAKTCPGSQPKPMGTPTAKQFYCGEDREDTMSTENVASKWSRGSATPKTFAVCTSKQNCPRNSAILETVCTSKKICPRNCATLENVCTSKQICPRNSATTQTLCKLKQNCSLNSTLSETVCTSKQNYSRNSAIPEVAAISKQNIYGKSTLPNSISTSNQYLQRSELSVYLKNGTGSLLKTETPKAVDWTDNPYHLIPLINFYNNTNYENNAITRSKRQSVESEVATPTEQPVDEDFNPHPYDDTASRNLYISSTALRPKSFCLKKSRNDHLKIKRRKQKRTREKNLQTSLPTSEMALDIPHAQQTRSLQEKQKELVKILADLSGVLTPHSSKLRQHRKPRQRQQKVVHSVVSYRFKRFHQLSGWLPTSTNPCTSKESASTCRRIRWCKRRVRKTTRGRRLRIVGP